MSVAAGPADARSRRMLVLLTLLSVPACGTGPATDTIQLPADSGLSEEPQVEGGRAPFRDSWRVEADLPFEHTTRVDGVWTTQIDALTVGGKESSGNFANRGDVIVNFDGPDGRILIELRRFSTSRSQEAAEQDFAKLSLWAFNANTDAPVKPDEMDPALNCTSGDWLDGCAVRVYYDGQKQLSRSGADIRVTLPPDYRRNLAVVTEDSAADAEYLNRGNVCVRAANGALDVSLQSGEVFVTVSGEATPAPQCGWPPNTNAMPSNEVRACTAPGDGEDSVAWSEQTCPCSPADYGVVRVRSEADTAANVTVDVPLDLWATIAIANEGPAPETCTVEIEIEGLVEVATRNAVGWEAKGVANAPSLLAPAGGGYRIEAYSSGCHPVAFTEDPAAFAGVNNGAAQVREQRGDLRVCNDCLRDDPCDTWVP